MAIFLLHIPLLVGLLLFPALGWADFREGQNTDKPGDHETAQAVVGEGGWQIWVKTTPSSDNLEKAWLPVREIPKLPTKEACESTLITMVQEMANEANRGDTDFVIPGKTTVFPNGRGIISLFKTPTSVIHSVVMEFSCFPDSLVPPPLKPIQDTITTIMSAEEDMVHQVNILMEFDVLSGSGRTAIVWGAFKSHTFLSEVDAKIATAVMVYARLLTSHEETRSELFNKVTDIAEELIMTGKFYTPDWNLNVLGHQFTLWPWTFHPATELQNPRVYKATLIQTVLTNTTGGLMDLGFGQERVLAPSAPLILIKGLSEEMNSKDNYRLGRALLEANIKFGAPENALPTTDLIVTNAVARKIPTLTEDNPSVQILGKDDAIQMFQFDLEAWNNNARRLANLGTVTTSEGEMKIYATNPDSIDSSMLIYQHPPNPLSHTGGLTTVHPLYLESKDIPTAIILRVTQPDESCLNMVARSLEIDIKKEMAPEFSIMSKFKQEEISKEESVCVATYHILPK